MAVGWMAPRIILGVTHTGGFVVGRAYDIKYYVSDSVVGAIWEANMFPSNLVIRYDHVSCGACLQARAKKVPRLKFLPFSHPYLSAVDA